VWTSSFSVSEELKLPGLFGSILSGSFGFFNRLLSMKKELSRSDIWGSLDAILYQAFPPSILPEPADGNSSRDKIMHKNWHTVWGILLACATFALYAYAAFFLKYN
jgi:hypothetical protein